MKRASNLCTGFDGQSHVNRRSFLHGFGLGAGAIALAQLEQSALGQTKRQTSGDDPIPGIRQFAPKAKTVIFLFQSGGPSQIDMFDRKPELNRLHGEQLPDEVRGQQRLTGMSGHQSSLPLVGSPFKFSQHGQCGRWVSELLPHTAKIVDKICVVDSMYTEAINHGPAVTFVQTGSQLPGRPSMGAWLDYGLGSVNENLPSFVVLISKDKSGQPLFSRLWGSGFLPTRHQGVQLRSGKDPVLYLNNPDGVDQTTRRRMLDALNDINRESIETGISNAGTSDVAQAVADPQIEARIAQYELGFRMQESIPEATDFSDEPASVLQQYGDRVTDFGSYAANCLLARRLAERGVRFIQLYHQGWDQHGNLPTDIRVQCQETDQASAALIDDLDQRGMLEETLVIWGGEFGRTNYCQGKLGATNFGRDHHPGCFSIWMAGGGTKAGYSYGKTDELSYNIVENKVHVHDFQATILHLMGIDHERLTFKYQGRHFRLTDVHGNVVNDVIA